MRWSSRCGVVVLVAMAASVHRAEADPGEAPPPARFQIDPVGDGALIASTASFVALSSLILSTTEIRPQRPADPGRLLGIDRMAVTQTIDPRARGLSNAGVFVAVGYAVLEPVFSGVRAGWQTAVVDASLYAETIAFTLALADIAKVSMRRPRPRAYLEQAKLDAQFGGADRSPSVSDTDSSLSFFSGHSSTVAAVGATATYLAFARSPATWRPWITLGAGVMLTGFVGYERVRAGAHFPTDVIAGALAGATIGVIVPHLHRGPESHRTLWVACAPAPGGGEVMLRGGF